MLSPLNFILLKLGTMGNRFQLGFQFRGSGWLAIHRKAAEPRRVDVRVRIRTVCHEE